MIINEIGLFSLYLYALNSIMNDVLTYFYWSSVRFSCVK